MCQKKHFFEKKLDKAKQQIYEGRTMKKNISIENIKNLLIEYYNVSTEEADKEVTKELIEKLNSDSSFLNLLEEDWENEIEKNQQLSVYIYDKFIV